MSIGDDIFVAIIMILNTLSLILIIAVSYADRQKTNLKMRNAGHDAAVQILRFIDVNKKLPALEEIVIVRYPSAFDGAHIYAWGARLDNEDHWLWAIKTDGGDIRICESADWNDIECGDDFPVTHWAPIPKPPEENE